MPTLYVVEQGAQIARRGERLIVRRGADTIASVPVHRVDQVVLLGRVNPTTPAIDLILAHEIPVFYMTQDGALKGVLTPPVGKNILLRRAQFRRADDPEFCLGVARAMVRAKLINQRAYCLRWRRDHGIESARDSAQELERLLRSVERAGADGLLGIEGAGAKAYYSALRELLADKVAFDRRTRRPPEDPVSALLGFGSALLRAQVFAAVSLVGFDPYLGFYHTQKYGRPALVLDLMEEFRPAIADATAAAVVSRQMLREEDFERHGGALLMTEAAIERFVAAFDRRLRSEVTHPITGTRLSYRGCIELQARMLGKAVLGELPGYLGFATEH